MWQALDAFFLVCAGLLFVVIAAIYLTKRTYKGDNDAH